MANKLIDIGFPADFWEAVYWATQRQVVLADVYYNQLPHYMRSIAFTVSNMASITQIQSVLDELADAAATGVTFEEWKKNAIANPEFGVLPKWHKENVFRTGNQTHYGAGRWRQFQANKQRRGYLMWSAINDSRVRPSHLAMDGVIRPVDDPLWSTWSCPAGFNCRCSLISLSDKQAKDRSKGKGRGLNKQVPADVQPDAGFDYNKATGHQSAVDSLLEQKISKIDPALAKAVKRNMEYNAPSVPLTNDEIAFLADQSKTDWRDYISIAVKATHGLVAVKKYWDMIPNEAKGLIKHFLSGYYKDLNRALRELTGNDLSIFEPYAIALNDVIDNFPKRYIGTTSRILDFASDKTKLTDYIDSHAVGDLVQYIGFQQFAEGELSLTGSNKVLLKILNSHSGIPVSELAEEAANDILFKHGNVFRIKDKRKQRNNWIIDLEEAA